MNGYNKGFGDGYVLGAANGGGGSDLPRFGLYFDGQLMLLPEDWITVDGDKLLIDESHMEVTADGKLLIDGGRLVPLTVTENGTYTPVDGEGFAPVIVQITASLQE